MIRYNTQVGENGAIMIPATPFAFGEEVEVVLQTPEASRTGTDKKPSIKAKRKATPAEVQKFMDTCYGCLEGLSDEEFEQIKMKRILGQ
jgi:hypothetical protein